MRATRRRQRRPDPLACPEAIRAVCKEMRSRMPGVIPNSERQLIRFLYAVRHVERRPVTDTKRGRPSRWKREDLISAASHLRSILDRETQGRVSLNSFLGQYLLILDFPADVQEALVDGRVNLQEAAQAARLTSERLGCAPAEARRMRCELLQSHVAVQGSQTQLRTRVRVLLGESVEPDISGGLGSVVSMVDELLDVDPSDSRHMFWEEMKRLFFAMREVEPEDLDDETMEDFLKAVDQVSNALQKIEKKRRVREQKT